jgi:hypothetical protein
VIYNLSRERDLVVHVLVGSRDIMPLYWKSYKTARDLGLNHIKASDAADTQVAAAITSGGLPLEARAVCVPPLHGICFFDIHAGAAIQEQPDLAPRLFLGLNHRHGPKWETNEDATYVVVHCAPEFTTTRIAKALPPHSTCQAAAADKNPAVPTYAPPAGPPAPMP